MAEKKLISKSFVITSVSVFLCLAVFILAFSLSGIGLENSLFGSLSDNFDKESDFVRIIDVGQGDSILIYSNGYSALIDTGLSIASPDVCTALETCGISRLDALLLTHLDNDHTGGMEAVTGIFGTDNLILPDISSESKELDSIQSAINNVTKSGGSIYNAVQGMNFKIGEFEITVLASFGDMENENNRSTVLAAEINGIKFLLTGDLEATAEKRLLNERLDLRCDILKVGHHGSSTSSKDEFLKKVQPQYAVISVGKDNSYGHPHSEVLSGLEYIGAKVYRTDNDGDVTFYVENKRIIIDTEK